MRLSPDEIETLLGVIDYFVPDLHAEIGRTREPELRARMREREAQLLDIRQRLLDERAEDEGDDLLGL